MEETLILYVEEETINNNDAVNVNGPQIKYRIQGKNADICRLCLDLSEVRPIRTCQFIKEFNNFMFIEVQLGVTFPKNACEKCTSKLDEMALFLKMCQNSLSTYEKMEENCAKLRANQVESEILEQVEMEINNANTSTDTSGVIDANIEQVFAKVEKEIASKCREENSDVNKELPVTMFELTVKRNVIEKGSEKKSQHNIKSESKQRSSNQKMCCVCGACVPSLAIHYMRSTNCKPKNFKCSLCNLHFATKHRLLSHQRVRHWDKISAKHFVCYICSKTYKHPETLHRHVRAHKNGKEFMCEVCGKNFGRQTELKDHKNIHSQSKPYFCRHCGKCFHSKRTHSAHEVRHTKTNLNERKSESTDPQRTLSAMLATENFQIRLI